MRERAWKPERGQRGFLGVRTVEKLGQKFQDLLGLFGLWRYLEELLESLDRQHDIFRVVIALGDAKTGMVKRFVAGIRQENPFVGRDSLVILRGPEVGVGRGPGGFHGLRRTGIILFEALPVFNGLAVVFELVERPAGL